jgi:hypothetical protein
MLDVIKNLIISKMQIKPNKNHTLIETRKLKPAKLKSIKEEAKEMKMAKAKPSSKATKMKSKKK